jgi:Site-specific recombinase XerC
MTRNNKKSPKKHPANTFDVKAEKRSRVFYSTKRAARVHSGRDLAIRNEREKKLGDKTIGCAAADLRGEFVDKLVKRDGTKDKKVQRAIEKLDRAMRRLSGICSGVRLITLDRAGVGELAEPLLQEVHTPGNADFYLSWLCRIIRHGFTGLEPPVHTPRDIPGRKPVYRYGSLAPQLNDKPIPYGRELIDRLTLATGILRVLLHLLIRCGLRIGEALALRRCDVEFEDAKGKGWLHVRSSQEPGGDRKEPKTTAGRRKIPLPKALATELEAWFASHPADPTDQVITDRAGRRLRYTFVKRMHQRFQKTIGGRSFTFHRYRAGCVTAWLVAGVKLDNIRIWIGHANLRVTINTYISSVAFADELWWKLHAEGKLENSPRERVRLSVVINDTEPRPSSLANGKSPIMLPMAA